MRTTTNRTNHTNPSTSDFTSRRGAFIIVVLVCLLVVGMLATSLLKLALLQTRQVAYEQARLQAAWLADAGFQRAADRLAADPDYSGEEWQVAAVDLGGSDAGLVTIRVQKEENNSPRRTIVVEALYPDAGPQPARLTREAAINISQGS